MTFAFYVLILDARHFCRGVGVVVGVVVVAAAVAAVAVVAAVAHVPSHGDVGHDGPSPDDCWMTVRRYCWANEVELPLLRPPRTLWRLLRPLQLASAHRHQPYEPYEPYGPNGPNGPEEDQYLNSAKERNKRMSKKINSIGTLQQHL